MDLASPNAPTLMKGVQTRHLGCGENVLRVYNFISHEWIKISGPYLLIQLRRLLQIYLGRWSRVALNGKDR